MKKTDAPATAFVAELHIDNDETAKAQRAALHARMGVLEISMEQNTALTRDVATQVKQAVVDATNAAVAAAEPIKTKADAAFQMTQEIRDLLRAAKAGLSVLKYLGLLATPIVAIATAWHYFMGNK